MLRTPEHLQQRYGIPADAGRMRAIPRVFLAMRNKRKSHALSVLFSLIVSGALPEHGQKRKQYRKIRQQDLAGMCGLASRATYTRRVSRIAPAARDDRPRPANSLPHLIHRDRQFAEPNRYAFAIPETRREDLPDRYFPPELGALVADARIRELWDQSFTGWRGYKDIPTWLWDRRLPLSDTARLVMTYYIFCGLLDKDTRGRIAGKTTPKQSTVAAAVGISVKAVYNANCELAGMGLIRVAHPEVKIEGGKMKRGPQIILYLPIRQFTRQEAQAEYERMRRAVEAARETAEAGRAHQIHAELLAAWTGREHSLAAFWNAARKQMLAAGIRRSLVSNLIPSPPD